MVLTSCKSSTREEYILDGVALTVADIQGLWAVLFVYATESEDEGGFGLGVSAMGRTMLIQGLLSTFLGPIIGHYHDECKTFRSKKILFMLLPVALLMITWIMILTIKSPGVLIAAMIVQGIAAGAYPPGICALSLDIVGICDFPERAGRNEMWKHVGAIITAGILPITVVTHGADGWRDFFVIIVCISILPVLLLSRASKTESEYTTIDSIDSKEKLIDVVGGGSEASGQGNYVPFRKLLFRPEILAFIICVSTFHFANAAMLPQLGYKLDLLYASNETDIESIDFGAWAIEIDGANGIGLATIISQVVMVPISKLAAWLATKPWAGSKRLFILGIVVLGFRGVLLSVSQNPHVLLWGGETMDGMAAAIFGVCAILLMGDLTQGTGQFAAMQGMIATCLGIGSACSHLLAGETTEEYGVNFTMLMLGCLAIIPFFAIMLVPDRRAKGEMTPLIVKSYTENDSYDSKIDSSTA